VDFTNRPRWDIREIGVNFLTGASDASGSGKQPGTGGGILKTGAGTGDDLATFCCWVVEVTVDVTVDDVFL
jgi:hypothetical protein